MQNLKLIISTRTQEEFDRVLQWAKKIVDFFPSDLISKDWEKYTSDTILIIDNGISYGNNDHYDGYIGVEKYNELSFPEFEKQYLTNENDVHKV